MNFYYNKNLVILNVKKQSISVRNIFFSTKKDAKNLPKSKKLNFFVNIFSQKSPKMNFSQWLILNILIFIITSYRIDYTFGYRIKLKKRDPQSSHMFAKRSSSGISETLSNSKNMMYYGTILVGNPAQEFTVNFDTGSSDFWLMSNDCRSIPCIFHRKFTSQLSTTFREDGRPFSIEYGDGSETKGVTAFDDLEINGLKIREQGLGLVKSCIGFLTLPVQGIIGLAFRSFSKTNFSNPIENAYSQGLIERNLFAFWLNRRMFDKNGGGGELIIGEIDSQHYLGNKIFLGILI